ncbi:hypothetical protein JCM8115_006241 [Rhodotorula mucilaginosa]|uniref:Zn(2)-C6 fungal-type domain-containing protein n=1 Tax=Rhodotorula mucilaginosa TaxID=5537 RepID=A0A9P6W1N8_RHOMI|nr:hypothetical protein C6P46_004863 [Rhodotorula mucilaginosa]
MSGLYDQQQPPPPHPVYNPPGVQSGSAPGADRMGSNPTAVAADGLASPSGGGPSPFSHPGQPLQPANEHAHSIVHSLYGSGGPSGPGGGGYYASNNTAMAAANYGTAPMHSSPGFPPIDHAGHAMLPPMHAQPPPPPSSSSSRRSLGSGEYPQQPPAADARFQRGLAHSAGPSYLAAQQHPQSHPRVPTPAAAAYPLASAIGANSVSTTNSALDGTGSQSLDTSPSQQHATTPSTPSGGGTNSQETTKSRSAMACQLCRRQKMKCEGPSKAPCRRCRAAGVACVFESPTSALPRVRSGGNAAQSWIDGRLQAFESRLSVLEDSAAGQSGALVQQRASSETQSVPPEMLSAHERRIAALEQQLYTLQLSIARTQPQPPPAAPPQPNVPPMGMYGSSYTVQHGGMSAYAPAMSEYGSPGAVPPHSARSDGYPTAPKHEPGLNSSTNGLKHAESDADDEHRGKRWKGEPGYGESDFIARGLVSEEEATMCFESYHLTFSYSDTNDEAPRQTRLSFEETRRRSPFFLAVVISIGARSLSRFDTFHVTFREALRLARQTFLPDAWMYDSELGLGNPGDRPPTLYPAYAPTWPTPAMNRAPHIVDTTEFEPRLSTLSLKALVLLGLYHAMPELLMHAWIAGYRFIWPSSLLEYEHMTNEERSSLRGLRSINIARVGVIACLWHSFYTYVRHQLGFVDHTPDLVRHHLEVISDSVYAEPVTDMVMRTNLEQNVILFEAFKKLGPAMRPAPPTAAEVYETIEKSLKKLDEWQQKHKHAMITVSQWGDSPELKHIVPLHHGRMWLLMYIYTCIPPDQLDLTLPRTRELARMSVESSIMILRWGVESRVWMPFSVVGNYVHIVQVPCAIFQLATCARWYPDILDCSVLRPLLHRLLQQCDATINGAGGTAREISRARRTKIEVQELDRLAFDLCGDETPSSNKACPLGGSGSLGSAAGSMGNEEPAAGGLFGQEITASLASLRLELNLWAKPLQAFEGDD